MVSVRAGHARRVPWQGRSWPSGRRQHALRLREGRRGLSLDADFLRAVRPSCAIRASSSTGAACVGKETSRADDESALRRREHAVESPARSPTIGCRCEPSEIDGFARAWRELEVEGAQAKRAPLDRTGQKRGSRLSRKISRTTRSRSIVLAGDGQPPLVHAWPTP